MKIFSIHNYPIRKTILPALLTGMFAVATPKYLWAKSELNKDTFTQTDTLKHRNDLFPLTEQEEQQIRVKKDSSKIKPAAPEHKIDLVKGANSEEFLKNAPNAKIKIAGKEKFAKFVVDISNNRLYKYDLDGKAQMVYSICSGKKSTPTYKGVRIVTDIEKFPYSGAHGTKRKKNPRDYGPNVICLATIDVKTGKNIGSNGQFIHGNNNAASIGKYWSKGCMRMDNGVIQQLAKEARRGDLVLIK